MFNRRQREDVLVRRSVMAETVPSGHPVELQEGMIAQITQALGGTFTLLVEGQLMRIKGEDADAIGKEPPRGLDMPDAPSVEEIEPLVWKVLRTCYDPEIPVNIVDLGLVYSVAIKPTGEQDKVHVFMDMTLTAPGCGMGESIANEACDKILTIPRVAEATVNLVFDPPWSRAMMSEGAKLALGM